MAAEDRPEPLVSASPNDQIVDTIPDSPLFVPRTTSQVSPVKEADDFGDEGEDDGDSTEDEDDDEQSAQYEFEPEPSALLDALLPRYISSRIFSALLESAASESAARRRAMKSASDNASELIKTYTRLANQARQAEITQEISEIVGGADALASAGVDE